MRIISGKYKRRKLLSPKDILTRPSTDRLRETLMGVLEGGKLGHPLKSKIIIDVFSGTGALGIEATSRGNPEKVIFIEYNINAISIIKENIKITNSPKLFDIINSDISNIVSWEYEPAELVFMDPPYFSNLFCKALANLVNINALLPGAIIVLETSSKEKIQVIKNFEQLLSKKIGKSLISFLKFSPSFK
jgi:16S rRNA (guanine966-N2)-methyltransferase